MAWWFVGAGAAMSIGGGILSDNASGSKYTTPEAQQFSTGSNYFGNANTSKKGKGTQINFENMNPMDEALAGGIGNAALPGLRQLQGFQNPTGIPRAGGYLAGAQTPGLFGDMQQASYGMPQGSYAPEMLGNVNAGYNNTLPQLNTTANLSNINNTGLAAQAGQTGLGLLQSGSAGDYAQQFGIGRALEGNTLNLLRDRASADNNRQASKKISSLYNKGQFGTTGGSDIMRQMVEAEDKQDLDFQLAAQNRGDTLAEQYSNVFDRQQRTGIGAMNSNFNFGGAQGNLNMGMLQGGAGQENQMFGRGAGLEQLGQDRTAGRFDRAQGYFGFANDLDTQNMERAIQAITGREQINTGQQNWVQLAANATTGMTDAMRPQASERGGSAAGGALGAVGGIVSGFSDRRLKRGINKIGKTEGGTNVYSFEYIWGGGTQIGVMADEVPYAAFEGPGGYQMVDYSKVL
jgi:hypothetical protein